VAHRNSGAAVRAGLQKSLPIMLLVTFLLVPSTATRIFKTFSCIAFEYDDLVTREYLLDDLRIRCHSDEHVRTRTAAIAMLFFWPVGTPCMYAVLLWWARRESQEGRAKALVRATAFLSDDYTPNSFWWEPVELCFKLTLTGWVLLISEQFEQLRVVVAILVTISFLSLNLAIKPFKRLDDAWVATMIELSLIGTYICVLLIKSCDLSSVSTDNRHERDLARAVCRTYGFGDDSSGVYQFFLVFLTSMVGLQLLHGCLRIICAGYMPKLFLVAAAHSVSPSTVLTRVIRRRAHYLGNQARHWLGLDVPRLSPRTAAAVVKFRAARGWPCPSGDVPPEVQPLATGNSATVYIEGVFPPTLAFVQVDLEAFVIRWTHRLSFVSLSTVVDIIQVGTPASHGSQRDGPSRLYPAYSSFQSQSSAIGKELLGESAPSGIPVQRAHKARSGPNSPSSSSPSPVSSKALVAVDGATQVYRREYRGKFSWPVQVIFSTDGGRQSVLEVRSSEAKATAWATGLRALCRMLPPIASPAHYRWALSCMSATGNRGQGALLPRSEIRSLLRCANASITLHTAELERALQLVRDSEQQQHLWSRCKVAGRAFNARQVTHLLMRLTTSSGDISELFNRFAVDGCMGLAEWETFSVEHQLVLPNDAHSASRGGTASEAAVARFSSEQAGPETDAGLEQARAMFDSAIATQTVASQAEGLGLLDFALLLLHPENDAVTPDQALSKKESDNLVAQPLAHYWIACSHNSYCVGDQLTGRSTSAVYRRQLLQGCRCMEIDCWDERRLVDGSKYPVVTHGHTFCTIVSFDEVARACGEAAFVTTALPVILSLEMHCSIPQQRVLAGLMIKHFGNTLLAYDEFLTLGKISSLTPLLLQRRILAKGKVALQAAKPPARRRRVGCVDARRVSQRVAFLISAAKDSRGSLASSSRHTKPSSSHSAARPSRTSGSSERLSSATSAMIEESSVGLSMEMAWARQKQQKSKKNKAFKHGFTTEPLYSACLCVRSVARERFLRNEPADWVVAITSFNEDRLLKEMGLTSEERNQVEGLSQVKMSVGPGISAAQLASITINRLAFDPPPGIFRIQQRTTHWLVRPFPHGLRFSGANMSPLLFWLSGAHLVALNFSEPDLAVQLHFALFDASGGFLLKPSEMLSGPQQTEDANSPRRSSNAADWRNRRASATDQQHGVRHGLLTPVDDGCSASRAKETRGVSTAATLDAPDSSRRLSTAGTLDEHDSSRRPSTVSAQDTPTSGRRWSTPAVPKARHCGEEGHNIRAHGHGNVAGLVDCSPRTWPPPREQLHRTTVEILSFHNAPKLRERRPQLNGRHAMCHEHHPELSGATVPPNVGEEPTSPALSISVHAIGGFCAISKTLPLQQTKQTHVVTTAVVVGNGMNAVFRETFHCLAAEPHTTFLRIGVIDGEQEVAYEMAVVGRLRRGYRVFRMRSTLCTRIELCFLLVWVGVGTESNTFATPRHQEVRLRQQNERIVQLESALRANETNTAPGMLLVQSESEGLQRTGEDWLSRRSRSGDPELQTAA